MIITKIKTAVKLQNDTESILKIFTDTIDKLSKIIEDSKASIERQNTIINEAEQEKASLSKLVTSNEQIISKINTILDRR